MMTRIIVFLLFLLFFVILYWYYSYNDSVFYKDYGDPNASVKICLVTGVHGNEPAGSLIFRELIKNGYFEEIVHSKNIFIRVLPHVNEFGLDFGVRYQNNFFNPDINRTFEEEGLENVSKDIIRLTKNMDIIIDFHEGWGFHLLNRKSLGSTLTSTENALPLAKLIVSELNNTIDDKYHKFVILNRMCSIKNALSCYLNNLGKKYILVETTGQDNIQPMEVRQYQIKVILDTIFENL